MGKAIELAYQNYDEYNYRLISLRNYFIGELEKNIPYIKLNGHRSKRLSGNVNFSFEYIKGEELLLDIDTKGICASTGSACSSGNSKPSHVLTSIGLPEDLAYGSLRVTFGECNTLEDIDYLIEVLIEAVGRLRSSSKEYQERLKKDMKY